MGDLTWRANKLAPLEHSSDQRGAAEGGARVLQGVRADVLQEPDADLRPGAPHRHLARLRPQDGEGPQRGPPAIHARAGIIQGRYM